MNKENEKMEGQVEYKKNDFFENNDDLVAVPKKGMNWMSILGMVLILIVVVFGAVAVLLYGFKNESQFVKMMATQFYYPFVAVEDKVIPMSEYWSSLELVKKNCELVGTNCQTTDDDRRTVSKRLIDERSVEVLAKKEGINVDNSELEAEYQKIVEQNGGETEFTNVIRDKLNWSTDEFKQKLLISLYGQKLEDKVIEKVSAKHILISADQSASEEDVAKAKEKAMEVIKKLKEGGDFAALAKEYSNDPSVSQNGGDLGYFSRGMMVPEFEKAAFALEKGQISEPVKTDFGWHIIKVEDKKGSVKNSFTDWLEEQKKQMKIVYFYKVPEAKTADNAVNATQADSTTAANQ
ncbi:MAG: peptidylprolyl isomerase [Patescibacteria group bacterium]